MGRGVRWSDRSDLGWCNTNDSIVLQRIIPAQEVLEEEPHHVDAVGFDSRNRTLGLFVEHLIIARKASSSTVCDTEVRMLVP